MAPVACFVQPIVAAVVVVVLPEHDRAVDCVAAVENAAAQL